MLAQLPETVAIGGTALSPRRTRWLAAAVLAGAMAVVAGCGTAPAAANSQSSTTTTSSTSGTTTSTTPATGTSSSTPASSASSSTAASSTSTSGSSSSSIPKTGLNPLVPVGGGLLVLLGATAVFGGWRRLQNGDR